LLYIDNMSNSNNIDLFLKESEEILQNSPIEWREKIKTYFESMNDMQKQTFIIAKNHLGTSFSIYKSNGFINYEKQLQTK